MQNQCSKCHATNIKDIKIICHPGKPNDYLCRKCFREYMDSIESIRGFGGSGINPDELRKMVIEVGHVQLNKPKHYHEHDIDTIEFLKRGFPPQVLTGFLIGNIIKYTQRFEYKNGEDDVLKIVDYAKRLEEWYKETHS
jgi:hypothetical protein